MKSLSKSEVLSFCKGHCKTKKKSKLSEILKYNKDTTIKVKFISVQFIFPLCHGDLQKTRQSR